MAMTRQERWNLKDVVGELADLKKFVLSYTGKYSKTSVPALERLCIVVELLVKEIKEIAITYKFPEDKHPLPPKPEFSWDSEPAMLMSYITEMINVVVCDFDMMRMFVNNEDPASASEGVLFFRQYLNVFRSKISKARDDAVSFELRMQKAEQVHIQIWKAKTIEVNLMMKLVYSFLTNPDHLGSVEKLKRIQLCLCDVINRGRVFISTHSFVPQQESFPLGQVAQISNPVEQASMKSLMRQHAHDGVDLVHLVSCCLDNLMSCDLCRLGMQDLNDIYDFVTTIEADLAKRAVEEGAQYPNVEE